MSKSLPDYIQLGRDKRKQLQDALAGGTVGVKGLSEIIKPSLPAGQYHRQTIEVDSIMDDYGNTLLHLAVQQLDENFVNILLLKGANPSIRNLSGCNPYRLAVLMGHAGIQESLLKCGAQPELLIGNWLPQISDLSNVQGGPGSKFNPSYQDLGNASFVGLGQVVSELLKEDQVDGGDAYGSTPLMKAANKGRSDIVQVLLGQGASVVARVDSHGYNSLLWACLGGHIEVVKLLVQEHIKLNGKDAMAQVINRSYGVTGLPKLTYLNAAVQSGDKDLVQYIMDLGASPQVMPGVMDPVQIATLNGNHKIVELIMSKRVKPQAIPIAQAEWLVQGLARIEGIQRDASTKSAVIPVLNKPPHEQAIVSPQQLLSAVSIVDKKTDSDGKLLKMDEKLFEYCKAKLGSRVKVVEVAGLEAGSQLSENRIIDIFAVKATPEHLDAINELASYFRNYGTHLDVVHMMMVQAILQLLSAVGDGDKAQYIVISGKAIQEATEVVRVIEQWLEKFDQTGSTSKDKSIYNYYGGSQLYSKIKSLVKSVKVDDIKNMLLVTRMAVGAWPPADAIPNMVKAALQLCRQCKLLVALAGASGHWPVGAVDIKQLGVQHMQVDTTVATSIPIVEESPSRNLSYSAYQRQAESKILDQIISSSSQRSPASVAVESPSISSPAISPSILNSPSKILATPLPTAPTKDDPFFASVDNWVRQFVQCIQKLKNAKERAAKEEFISLASAAYTKVDGMIDEIRPYYLFKDIDYSYIINEAKNPTPFKQQLREYQTQLLQASDEIILKAKLASGVWPTPKSSTEMMQATFPVVQQIRDMVTYVKEACTVIRRTENSERTKMEAFMRDWEHNQKVRDLFNQWESLSLKSIKSDTEGISQEQLSEFDAKLLEDTNEGLLLEKKESKEIIKGGKLAKLVDRLADHNLPDNDYRQVFLLTHQSFTSSLDFVDLLIKRYDISPPYNLDQRQFEVFVNRKIAPIRLRVYNVLKVWMNTYTEDFLKSRELVEKCLKFVETKMATDFGEITGTLVQSLKSHLDGQVKIAARAQEDISQRVPAPKSLLPKNIDVAQLGAFLATSPRHFADMDPIEFARQLTLVDFGIFKEIRPKELLDLGWEKPDKLIRSPNISKLIKSTNNLTYWVVTQIVICEDIKFRVNLIKFFINVAQACFDLKNYNAVTSLVAGLTQGPVFRMTKTWKLFRDKNAKISDMYAELSDSVSAKGQYAKYRQILKASTPPILPFLGVYLTDLTFIDLGNPDYLPETNYINFEKRRKTSLIIDDLLRYQNMSFNLQPIPGLQLFIQAFGKDGFMDEKQFYEKSLVAEPREDSDDED